MPRIADRMSVPSNYVEAAPAQPPPQVTLSSPSYEPGPSPVTCCPMPLVKAYPDGLRQFYKSGIPQTRIVPI